jgi:hypothetical protein
VQSTFFIKRKESFTTRHNGRIPKERRNNKITLKTNGGKRKEISHPQHKLDYRKEAEEGTTKRPPSTAQDLHKRTPRRLAHRRLPKQLAIAWTEVEVPQDDASRKGATTTTPSSAHPRRGKPDLHLANQGDWWPRQCPQQSKSIVGLEEARQGFHPSLGCQSTTGQRKQEEGKTVENAAGSLGTG